MTTETHLLVSLAAFQSPLASVDHVSSEAMILTRDRS